MKVGKNILFHFDDDIYFIGVITHKLEPGYKVRVSLEINKDVIKTVSRNAAISKDQIIRKGYKKFVYDNPEYFI